MPIGLCTIGAVSLACTFSSSAATTASASAASSNTTSTGSQRRDGSRPVGMK